MASIPFAEYQVEVAPFWLRQPNGQRWLESHGLMKDAVVAETKEAVKARFPTYCPPDALTALGVERGLPRYDTDTDATHRARLLDAWNLWRWGGTAKGILNELVRAFGVFEPFVVVSQRGREWRQTSLAPADVEYQDTGQRAFQSPNFWNSFQLWVIPPLPTGFSPAPADDSDIANTLRTILRRWKSGHSVVDRIVILGADYVASNSWGLPLSQDNSPEDALTHWGDASKVWGNTAGPYYITP